MEWRSRFILPVCPPLRQRGEARKEKPERHANRQRVARVDGATCLLGQLVGGGFRRVGVLLSLFAFAEILFDDAGAADDEAHHQRRPQQRPGLLQRKLGEHFDQKPQAHYDDEGPKEIECKFQHKI